MSIVRSSMISALCAGLIFVPSLCAAQPFAQIHADSTIKPVTATGGIIFPTGAVFIGEHFTVKHKVVGEYVVTFAKGLFALNPIFTCGAFGSGSPPAPPGCILYALHWVDAAHPATATFHTYDSKGESVDTAFTFTAIAVQSNVSH